MNTSRFTREDLELFSFVSHDKNPLHMSDEYARRTPYGGRVVFGVLNGLTALGLLPDRPGFILSAIEFEFFDTALMGIDYAVQVSEDSSSQSTVRVMDGRRPVLEAVMTFRPGIAASNQRIAAWKPTLSEAKQLTIAELKVGVGAHGTYGPATDELQAIRSRIQLKQSWATPFHVAALMWSSYLVGMELPGRRALFSRLMIEFNDLSAAAIPFEYQSEIAEVSDVGELTIQAALRSNGVTWARATLGAHVREDLPPATTGSVEKLVGRSQQLAGKVALITGASRGLGAALVRAFALHGCSVLLNYLHSQHDAAELRDSLTQTPGKVVLAAGDAASMSWGQETANRIAGEFRRLDFLVCNASPPLLPLWLEMSAGERLNQFIEKSLSLVSTPMMAFSPMLNVQKGWNVLISSTAVAQPHPHFPHYVVAKCAAEAMLRAASTEYRGVSSLIVRPSRLLTDLTNTPLGRRGALAPEWVASAVLKRLLEKPIPGQVEVIDRFANS